MSKDSSSAKLRSCRGEVSGFYLFAMLLAAAAAAALPLQTGFVPETSLSLNLPVSPGCPALGILGSTQNMITPPLDPVDLAVSLVTGSGEISLPDQFAVEISPYWILKSDDNQLFAGCADDIPSFQRLMQGTTASLAYGSTPGDSSARSVAVGLRIPLSTGSVEEEYSDLVMLFNEFQAELTRMTENALYDAELITSLPLTGMYADAIQHMDAFQRNVETLSGISFDRLRSTITGRELRRTGWSAEIAAASAWNVSESEFVEKGLIRYGAWLSGGYSFRNMAFAGVVRYMNDTVGEEERNTADTGCRAILSSISPLKVSAEIIHRYSPDVTHSSQWRVAGNVQMPLGSNRAFGITFGKDYSPLDESNGFVGVGVTLGMGSSRPIRTGSQGFSR